MPFSNYKTVSSVLKEFQITYTESNFIVETEFHVSDYFREDLEFTMREGVVDNSEFAICENLIYPVIKEVWKRYYSGFVLWSHQSLTYDQYLSGFPEYILAKRSVLSCYAAKPDKIALPLFLIFRSHLITISPSFNNLCSNSDNSSTDLNSRCAIYSFAECQTNSIKL